MPEGCRAVAAVAGIEEDLYSVEEHDSILARHSFAADRRRRSRLKSPAPEFGLPAELPKSSATRALGSAPHGRLAQRHTGAWLLIEALCHGWQGRGGGLLRLRAEAD